MLGEARSDLLLELLDGCGGVADRVAEEDACHAVQRAARTFEGDDRVLEGRRLIGARDPLDLGKVLGEAGVEGRQVVLVPDGRERGQLVVEGAGLKERVAHGN